ncbi:hypothetical protein HIMB11_03227, partial [Rhodobacteraceae bacterium HIMB11]
MIFEDTAFENHGVDLMTSGLKHNHAVTAKCSVTCDYVSSLFFVYQIY